MGRPVSGHKSQRILLLNYKDFHQNTYYHNNGFVFFLIFNPWTAIGYCFIEAILVFKVIFISLHFSQDFIKFGFIIWFKVKILKNGIYSHGYWEGQELRACKWRRSSHRLCCNKLPIKLNYFCHLLVVACYGDSKK